MCEIEVQFIRESISQIAIAGFVLAIDQRDVPALVNDLLLIFNRERRFFNFVNRCGFPIVSDRASKLTVK